jgi:FixJ family two-component response regulator
MKPAARVHVIDDDASVRKALQRLLRSAGIEAQTFASADEFLRAHVPTPDCLILDVRMPGMSGLELQQRLLSENIHVPIIFISAHDDEHARQAALAAGAIEFLHKPFEQDDLLECLLRIVPCSTNSQ